MSKLKFYHITRKENRESILKNGLVPSIGANRLRCCRRDERESKDARVSLCSFEEIEKWKDNIYKKGFPINLSVYVVFPFLYLFKRT